MILGNSALWGQNRKMKKADAYVEALQYQEAIQLYHKVLKRNDWVEAKTKLADTYMKIQDYPSATHWYQQAIAQNKLSPINYLRYGYALLYDGHCEKADSVFQQYLQMSPLDPRQEKLADICAYWQEITTKETPWTSFERAPFNSTYSDLGPAFYQDGLVFSSVRERRDNNNQLFFDLFFTPILSHQDSIVWGEVDVFSGTFSDKNNQAIARFSPDQQQLFLTRNQPTKEGENIVRLEIMSTQQASFNLWADLSPFDYNDESYSVAHPTLSADGKLLFFSSDMPGGFGGKDLYVCTRQGEDNWSSPINLGQGVNTEGDELYPFLAEKDILYFSSDGHPGIGGQDVFVASYSTEIGWGSTQNLGKPINSSKDDFDFVLHPDKYWGIVVSNREMTQGDDLYIFKQQAPTTANKTFHFVAQDKHSKTPLTNMRWNNDCDKLGETFDIEAQTITMQEEECCTLIAQKDNYNMQLAELCAIDYMDGDTVIVSLQKNQTTLSGQLVNASTQEGTSFAIVEVLKDGELMENSILTDENGHFSITIKEAGCYQIRTEQNNTTTTSTSYCIDEKLEAQQMTTVVVGEANITSKETIETASAVVQQEFTENTILSTEETAIEYLINVYYDVGRSSVQKESITELDRLFNLLAANEDVIVEISSHTDSQGSDEFNLRLSQKRANVIVRYLVSRGISSKRLLPKGYGETAPVNGCIDGVDCTEEQLQENRRTTFKVLGMIAGQSQ